MSEKKELCIRFFAKVDEYTTNILMDSLDRAINDNYQKLHLLISSPGGSVYHGLSLYNYLVSAPIELCTYNFGSVDSIGVVLFCSGRERKSVKHARFLLHPVQSNILANSSMDEKAIDELLKGLKIDQSNIAKVIANTITSKTLQEIEGMIHNRTTMTPEDAAEIGLVHSVEELNIPVNKGLVPIYNRQSYPPAPGSITRNNVEGFTAIKENFLYPTDNFTRSPF